MTFTKKSIKVLITLTPKVSESGGIVQPAFDAIGNDTVTLGGYRTSVSITKPGFPSQGNAQVRVYGMTLSLMNQLSTLGRTPLKRGFNLIRILAGDLGGESLIFAGNMTQAYTDLSGAPENIFHIFAFSAAFAAVQMIPPTSYVGSVDIDTVMRKFAQQIGYDYINYGASAVLSNPYFCGSALTQIKAAAEEANVECYCDNGALLIWPRASPSSATPEVIISAKKGMVSYPYSSGQGLMGVKSVFLPTVTYGSLVTVQSEIGPANGVWRVVNLTHDIEAEMPDGQWFTSLTLAPPFSKRIS